jgi:bifunctional non-homologous end joining protein LigD
VVPQYFPMPPTLVPEPFHRPGWVYEEKVDGWRILAYEDGARVRLLSRNGVDHAGRFRELAAAIAALSVPTFVLDGDVAIFDAQLRSRFELLRHAGPNIVATPPVYIAFDLLYRDGADMSAWPLRHGPVRRVRINPGLSFIRAAVSRRQPRWRLSHDRHC